MRRGLQYVVDSEFVTDAFFDFRVICESAITHDFDSVGISVFEMTCFEDFTVGSFAYTLTEFIFADNSFKL